MLIKIVFKLRILFAIKQPLFLLIKSDFIRVYRAPRKNFKNLSKKVLTKSFCYDILLKHSKLQRFAGVAQLVEQLICNQQVGGSSPSTSSTEFSQELNMGEFPSGQRGQTVNLLLLRFDGSNPSSPTTKVR